jgi:hypothetical protein
MNKILSAEEFRDKYYPIVDVKVRLNILFDALETYQNARQEYKKLAESRQREIAEINDEEHLTKAQLSKMSSSEIQHQKNKYFLLRKEVEKKYEKDIYKYSSIAKEFKQRASLAEQYNHIFDRLVANGKYEFTRESSCEDDITELYERSKDVANIFSRLGYKVSAGVESYDKDITEYDEDDCGCKMENCRTFSVKYYVFDFQISF